MQRNHNESVKKPFRRRTVGIAGLILAGTVGLSTAGLTAASADEPTCVEEVVVVEGVKTIISRCF